jgi:ribosomal protein S12 methylthiotransferase
VSYFDLSLQHVAPSVLKGMGRWGGRDRFERMIDRIRALDPLAGLRSTFILGFPGESDEDAEQVSAFVGDVDIDWVGTFTYSREVGTRSYDMADQVPEALARERAESVGSVAEETMVRRARALVGERFEVMAERFDLAEGAWIGRSKREAPEIDGEIRFAKQQPLEVGRYIDVTITGSDGVDLTGEWHAG